MVQTRLISKLLMQCVLVQLNQHLGVMWYKLMSLHGRVIVCPVIVSGQLFVYWCVQVCTIINMFMVTLCISVAWCSPFGNHAHPINICYDYNNYISIIILYLLTASN